jgi:serine/threonine protein phosphatase 1
VRYLAIGDIHGCFDALRALAGAIPFIESDAVITLGDYVDRGPQSAAVLDWLIAWQKRGSLIALRGNHDIMMLEARNGGEAYKRWLKEGGTATLKSYSPFDDAGRLSDVPDEHWEFLEGLRPWYETPTHLFVHANAYPDYPLAEQPDYMLYWEQINDPSPHESGKVLVCGHAPQKTGEPLNFDHAVCIDTWVHGGGWLTGLDVSSGQYWQANQRGEVRARRLGH